ncbi:MAG: hypothetical protein ABIF88_02245 [archaeon]
MAERKKYINVKIPFLDSTMRVLGTPENLHNKTIKLDLSRKLRGKGLTVTLRIFNQKGKLFAIPNKMELTKPFIRRMLRKRTNYVEDSFVIKCEDIKAIIKPLLITRKRVSRVVRKNLRNTTRELLIESLKEKEYYDICRELLDGILQKTLLPKLKKIYPLSFCDIRVFETKELEKIDLNKIISESKEEVENDEESANQIGEDEAIKEELKEEAEELEKEKKPKSKKTTKKKKVEDD